MREFAHFSIGPEASRALWAVRHQGRPLVFRTVLGNDQSAPCARRQLNSVTERTLILS